MEARRIYCYLLAITIATLNADAACADDAPKIKSALSTLTAETLLVNDPPVPDPNDPSRLDPNPFKGETMTYYGRWTYKFESAAAHGAKAAIIVHQAGPAGYPWGVIMISSGREHFEIRDAGEAHADMEGWITIDNARKLCAAAGQDFDALKQSAARRDFRPVSLEARAN